MEKYNIASLGEILWDVLPAGELPGGAPLNVAYHLQQLSQRVAVVSRVGADEHGRRLLQVLREQRLPTGFIQEDEAYPTGMVYARMDAHNDMQYDICYPAAWDHISWNAQLEALLGSSDLQYLVYGSLLARHSVSRKALEKALQSRACKVLDINLRPPHYTQETLEWLLHSCNILKLNIAELDLISAWYGYGPSPEARITALATRFNIDTVVVTLGSKGCMGYIKGQFHYQPGRPVKVADTIGSGDAFLAGFLACTAEGRSPGYALAFANALGALVASRPGGCPVYGREELVVDALV